MVTRVLLFVVLLTFGSFIAGANAQTAPATGASLAEWILDGRPTTVDITPYDLARFTEGRPIRGRDSYGALWEDSVSPT